MFRNVIGCVATIAATAGSASASYLGPAPYLQFSDSPFYAPYVASSFSYFHLENFEDGLLNTPGVSGSSGFVAAPGSATDSVDGDDGAVDGSGAGGHSFEFFQHTLTFTFDSEALGGLPTSAGLVWTDVGGPDYDAVSFEAFDAGGVSLGLLGPAAVGDGSVESQTAEDRFFGIVYAGGISKISLHVNILDTEIDHLQYGMMVPVPGVGMIALTGGVMAIGRRRR
jgi:hypothetical protein